MAAGLVTSPAEAQYHPVKQPESVVGIQNRTSKSAMITVYVTHCSIKVLSPAMPIPIGSCDAERIGYTFCLASGHYVQPRYPVPVTHVHAQVMRDANCGHPILMQRTLTFPFNNGHAVNTRKYEISQAGENSYEFTITGHINL